MNIIGTFFERNCTTVVQEVKLIAFMNTQWCSRSSTLLILPDLRV